eukprot:496796-Pelagomonas_calceolata.AAC.9
MRPFSHQQALLYRSCDQVLGCISSLFACICGPDCHELAAMLNLPNLVQSAFTQTIRAASRNCSYLTSLAKQSLLALAASPGQHGL